MSLALPFIVHLLRGNNKSWLVLKRYKTKQFGVDAIYALFELTHLTQILIMTPAAILIGRFLQNNFGGLNLTYFHNKPAWLQILVLYLAIDFAAYLWHRLQHVSLIAWQFHKAHHSQEVISALTTFRKTIPDRILDLFMLTIPAFILSIDYTYPVYIFIVNNIHQVLIHTDTGISFGIFDKVLVSPQFHEYHHSKDEKHLMCNYGVVFSIWDHLLGTYVPPVKGEKLNYGLYAK